MQPDHDAEFSRLLGEKMDKHKAPDQLRNRIIASLAQERQSSLTGRLASTRLYVQAHWRALAAAVASGAAATLLVTHFLARPAGDGNLMLQVAASHTRAMLANHLTDVASSDQHTVKPWFATKIDYSPRVSDFAKEGFELTGGRVDYVNDRVVAALVYKRRLHVIDAFVWPTHEADSPVRRQSHQGINMLEWTEGGMKNCLVSDIEFNELSELARLMRAPRTS